MRTPLIFVILLSLFMPPGCMFSSEPASDIWFVPTDRWGVARNGTSMATKSTWTGRLGWREVRDWHGGTHRVAVLTEVSGLNPRDQVSRFGAVVENRPMPDTFFLAGYGYVLLTAVDVHEGYVRARGYLHNQFAGGVIYANGQPGTAYIEDEQGAWAPVSPIIRLDKIEPTTKELR